MSEVPGTTFTIGGIDVPRRDMLPAEMGEFLRA